MASILLGHLNIASCLDIIIHNVFCSHEHSNVKPTVEMAVESKQVVIVLYLKDGTFNKSVL